MLLVPETLDDYCRQLADALNEQRLDDAAAITRNLSATRIAKVMLEAPRQSVIDTLKIVPDGRGGRILGQMPPEYAAGLLIEMEPVEAGRLFEQMPDDNATDILQILDDEHDHLLLSNTSESFRKRLMELRQYPIGSAGGVMQPHFLAIDRTKTVGQTIDAIMAAPAAVERAAYIYVVDERSRPIGVISLKDLLRYERTRPVGAVMNPNVVAVNVTDTAIEAARLLRNRRFTMLPVLDEQNAIVGVITFDDAMDILAENVAEQFAGLGAGVREESFFTPAGQSVRMRLPWMAANVFLNLGAVAVITGFETTIATIAILAAFLPMITDMGGNVGIQSLSVAIRSIALGEVRLGDFWKAARKEVTIGLINGAALGLLFAIVATVWQSLPMVETEFNPLIGVLAGIALGTNVLVAGIVGGVLPFAIKRMGKDPAMMTGPILTTITDITGVTIYLGLCTIFLL